MENPYIAMLKAAQARNAGTSSTQSLEDYGLANVDCARCGNSGYLMEVRDGELFTRECPCMNTRRSLRRIKNSGMEDMLSRYKFDSYSHSDNRRRQIFEAAQKFAAADSGWLFITGRSGSGKTHICTAVCDELIRRGRNVYYMLWRDEIRALKGIVNDEEINEPLKKLKTVSVLYIDDFLKGGWTDADIRLAFEILNARYNDVRLRTIISSELTLEQIFDIDEALAGRIYERAKGCTLRAPDENWRLN